jgi:hypothetical protein
VSTGSPGAGPGAGPAEVWARLREAASRSREQTAVTVSALAAERAAIERERREHPSYDEARRERARLGARRTDRATGPP